MRRIAWAGGIASAALIAGLATTPAMAGSVTTSPQSAVTHITNRPDSGDHGNNWADDNFTRTVVLTRHSQVTPADCGVVSGSCWNYTYTIKDAGTFSTIPGQMSPRTGTNLDLEVTGSINGGTTTGQFYATSGSPHGYLVPTSENDHDAVPTGDHTTSLWVEQFFSPGTSVFSAINLGSNAGWTYRLNFGADSQCPNDAYQWVDAAPDWGVGNIHGDILAPNAADCT